MPACSLSCLAITNPRSWSSWLRIQESLIIMKKIHEAFAWTLVNWPEHAIMALFQAVSINSTLEGLCVYDRVQLSQGRVLEQLLEIVPRMRIRCLHIHLDFMNESVLSCFHRKTSIEHLHSGDSRAEIADGPVFGIVKSNRLLENAINLLLMNLVKPWFHWALGQGTWTTFSRRPRNNGYI